MEAGKGGSSSVVHDEQMPKEVEHEMPRIVMPPPPTIPHIDPAVEDIFDFGAGPDDDTEEGLRTGPAQVAVPQSTGFIRLNNPEEEK